MSYSIIGYHGTRDIFKKFNYQNRIRSHRSVNGKIGIFFSASPYIASKFSCDNWWVSCGEYNTHSNVWKCILTFHNPLIISHYEYDQLLKSLIKEYDNKSYPEIFRERCIKEGYDGIVITPDWHHNNWFDDKNYDMRFEFKHEQYIVLDEKCIIPYYLRKFI